MRWIATAVVFIGCIFVSLRPAKLWDVDLETGLVVLDTEELSRPKHPPLVNGINALMRGVPPAFVRYLIPLDEKSLVDAAQTKVCSIYRLRTSTQEALSCIHLRLLSPMDLKMKAPVRTDSPNQIATMPWIVEGMRALLYDLDGGVRCHERSRSSFLSCGPLEKAFGVCIVLRDQGH